MSEPKKRSFKVIFNGEERGRIKARAPRQGAAKALTSIRKNNENYKAGEWNEFSLVETTRGCKNKKTFKYTGKVVDLETPHEVQMGGQTVVYKHRSTVKRVNKKDKKVEKTNAKN